MTSIAVCIMSTLTDSTSSNRALSSSLRGYCSTVWVEVVVGVPGRTAASTVLFLRGDNVWSGAGRLSPGGANSVVGHVGTANDALGLDGV